MSDRVDYLRALDHVIGYGSTDPADLVALRDLRDRVAASHPANDLNMEFESAPAGTERPPAGENLAGGLTVAAAVIDATGAGLGFVPALAFTFFAGNGVDVIAEPVLALDATRLRGVKTLVGTAVDAAVNAARKGRTH